MENNKESKHYVVEFILNDSDYGDGNVMISCWNFERDSNDINPVIKEAKNYAKKKNYKYFIIHDGNINHVLYDSKINN